MTLRQIGEKPGFTHKEMRGFFPITGAYTHNLIRPGPNQAIIDQFTQQQKQCKNTYGYRRMQL